MYLPSIKQSIQPSLLTAKAKQFLQGSIAKLFAEDSQRFETFSLERCNLFLDYSKQNIDADTLKHLLAWAEDLQLEQTIKDMFAGKKINHTENRAVLHSILRAPAEQQQQVLPADLCAEIESANLKMQSLCKRLHRGEYMGATGLAITDVIAIGIGGSYYGAKVSQEALKPFHQQLVKVHYLSNIDGSAIAEKIASLNPQTTLVLVISKTFSTQETLLNAKSAKSWLQSNLPGYDISEHFIAVSSNVDKALAFGIKNENILPMWDWVGGRFSLWSAVGLPLAIAIGYENFQQLRAGAYDIDKHLQTAKLSENMPVLMALLGIWNSCFLGHQSLAILPYEHSLRAFPGYLQQVDMESNGKRVDHLGNEIELATAPIVFGQEGTNGQHAFMQLMHQSKQIIPADFIVSLTSGSDYHHHHTLLIANCFAQSEALMVGKSLESAKQELVMQGLNSQDVERLAPHKVMPGNSPSNTLTFNHLTPRVLGAVLALYEHKVFVQGAMWQLNSFDQWGVELGKQLGNSILAVMGGEDNDALSASTKGLITKYLAKRA